MRNRDELGHLLEKEGAEVGAELGVMVGARPCRSADLAPTSLARPGCMALGSRPCVREPLAAAAGQRVEAAAGARAR
jgi:hypothetical protein